MKIVSCIYPNILTKFEHLKMRANMETRSHDGTAKMIICDCDKALMLKDDLWAMKALISVVARAFGFAQIAVLCEAGDCSLQSFV